MKKRLVVLYIICIIILSGGFYFLIKADFDKIAEYTPSNKIYNTEINYEIKTVNQSSDYITIDALVNAKEKEGNNYANKKILLKDESGKILIINSQMKLTDPSLEKIDDSTNFTYSELVGKVKKSKLNKNSQYTVGLLIKNQSKEEKVVFTDTVIKVDSK